VSRSRSITSNAALIAARADKTSWFSSGPEVRSRRSKRRKQSATRLPHSAALPVIGRQSEIQDCAGPKSSLELSGIAIAGSSSIFGRVRLL